MQSLLLLHGAIGCEEQLKPLAEILSSNYDVHTLNFSGHGGKPFYAEPFSMHLFSNNILSYLQEKGIEKTSIFGYSMGGYVGMYLAKHYPEKLNALVTLATKFHWTEEIALKEVQMLDPEKISSKVPAFAKTLEERHAPQDWRQVLAFTAEMMLQLGKDNVLKTPDHETIQHPCLIMLGDRDKMVSLEETVNVYRSLPNSQLAVLPNTPHPIEQVDKELLAYFIRRFIQSEF